MKGSRAGQISSQVMVVPGSVPNASPRLIETIVGRNPAGVKEAVVHERTRRTAWRSSPYCRGWYKFVRPSSEGDRRYLALIAVSRELPAPGAIDRR